MTARSGVPVNVVTGQDNALSGTPQQRPNVKGSPELPSDRPLQDKLAHWFDASVFSYPTAGAFGTTGRNVIIGPAQKSTSAALLKDFFKERR